MSETPREARKRATANALRELRESDAWQILSRELRKLRDDLDRRLVSLPLSQVDNALRYTRHDLERETRRMIDNFVSLPDDLVASLAPAPDGDPLAR